MRYDDIEIGTEYQYGPRDAHGVVTAKGLDVNRVITKGGLLAIGKGPAVRIDDRWITLPQVKEPYADTVARLERGRRRRARRAGGTLSAGQVAGY